jgi:Uma2 family endonuclease
VASTKTATEETLLHMPQDGRKYELVNGRILVSPAGMRHGQISVRLAARLYAHVSSRKLGEVLDSSTGYRLPWGDVRSPDVTFIAADRLPATMPSDFGTVAPDLAVEVLSPGDNPSEIRRKVEDYLRWGVRLVWVIDPRTSNATVHRPGESPKQVATDQPLEGADVIAGFACLLSDLLS